MLFLFCFIKFPVLQTNKRKPPTLPNCIGLDSWPSWWRCLAVFYSSNKFWSIWFWLQQCFNIRYLNKCKAKWLTSAWISPHHKGAALYPTSKAEYGRIVINKKIHTHKYRKYVKKHLFPPPKLGIKTSLCFIECHANYMDFPQNLLPRWKRTHEK